MLSLKLELLSNEWRLVICVCSKTHKNLISQTHAFSSEQQICVWYESESIHDKKKMMDGGNLVEEEDVMTKLRAIKRDKIPVRVSPSVRRLTICVSGWTKLEKYRGPHGPSCLICQELSRLQLGCVGTPGNVLKLRNSPLICPHNLTLCLLN